LNLTGFKQKNPLEFQTGFYIMYIYIISTRSSLLNDDDVSCLIAWMQIYYFYLNQIMVS